MTNIDIFKAELQVANIDDAFRKRIFRVLDTIRNEYIPKIGCSLYANVIAIYFDDVFILIHPDNPIYWRVGNGIMHLNNLLTLSAILRDMYKKPFWSF